MNNQPEPEVDDRLTWPGLIVIGFVFLIMASCWLMYAGGKL